MSYTKPYSIDASSGGDTVKEAIVDKVDKNADQIVSDLNTHEALTATHGGSGAIVGTTNTQTLTNKSLSDSTTYIVDETTATKKLQFSVGGNTAAVTGTIATAFTTAKVVTLPDTEGTVYVSGGTDVPVTDGGTGSSTASGARTNLGVGSGDSPTLTGLTLSGLTASLPAFTGASKELVSKSAADTRTALAITALGLLANGTANFKTFMNAAGNAPEWAKGIIQKSYTFNMNVTTNQVLTGAGFQPSGVIIIGGNQGKSQSVGFSDFTTNYSVNMYTGISMYIDVSYCMYAWESAGYTNQLTAIANTDGVTLVPAKTGAPSDQLILSVFYLR